jgi:two-component system nitrogen regulation sensor histidine kinase NtrY
MPDWLYSWRDDRAAAPEAEVRRRRREALLIAVVAVVFVIFALFEIQLPELSQSGSQSGNVIFFLLINLNLILLVLLIFLVTRNLVKLIFERRRGILGARLRTRLVLAFVSLVLFPTVLLFLVAQGFLSAAMQNWFSYRVENAIDGSLEVAERYYQRAGNDALYFAGRMAVEIRDRGLWRPGRSEELRRFVAAQREALNLDVVEAIFAERTERASRIEESGEPIQPSDRRSMLAEGREFTRTQPLKRGDLVRGGVPIRNQDGAIVGAVVTGYVVPRGVSKAARRTVRSYREYRQLSFLKGPLRNGYTLTFFLITLVVLFSATWFGFYFAKGITVPIQRLGEGMREVAQGNWDYRAEAAGDEEIQTLVTSFNQMTAELKTIHSALEERRRYIENVLANVTAGVVSIDERDRVVTVNVAAGAMLGVDAAAVRGRGWREVFGGADLGAVGELIERLRGSGRGKVEQQVELLSGRRPLTAWVTATALSDENGGAGGVILFFEDVTQLLRAERMEAWREVARRIAHEIKNPLTPIQLSAQRLRKYYGARLAPGEQSLLEECTRTIIGQVEQLKRLVNEFSTFARLPAVERAPHDLNEVVEEALMLFRDSHSEIEFTWKPAAELPAVDIDRDAIKRALINLLDNAVAACREIAEAGRVELCTVHDARVGVVRLEVADDGCGMTAEVKARAFEPYFSTKKDGTGLGLPIVSAIAADHLAYVRVHDNVPRGTRLAIEFPLRQAAALGAVAGG